MNDQINLALQESEHTDSADSDDSSVEGESSPSKSLCNKKIENFSLTAIQVQATAKTRTPAVRKYRKKTIRKQAKPSLSSDPTSSNVFKCAYCNKSYPKSVSLGGHISKAHAGESDRFREKMKVYQRR